MSQVVNYRHGLLESIKKRNSVEYEPFAKLVKSNIKLVDLNAALKSEITEIKLANQKLQQENLEFLKSPGANLNAAYPPEKLRLLDEQLLRAKGDVIDLQKKLIDQSDQVISLNRLLKEKDDELAGQLVKYLELEKQLESFRIINKDLESRLVFYDEQIKLWKDEKVECEVQYNCLVQKYDKLKEDYQAILTASLRFREEQIEKVNKLNELENERIQAKLKEELEKASQPTADFINITTGNYVSVAPATSQVPVTNFKTQLNVLPLVTKPIFKFDCHEGEVNAIRYHKSGKYFATGGGDRKIKLWEFKDGKSELISNLIGSNASIASIDIDNENNLIAGTSFDFACRLWSLNEHRLRMSSGDLQPTHTLTGHTNKVLAGKFLGIMKVATGSYDRTIKIWDLMQKACIKTLFAGSSCNDLVTLDSQTIISGHIDKKIRFWDTRSDPAQTEILLQGKITALDISSNKNYLLASIRDVNTLKLIDIRMNQVTETYCSDDFKIGYDWSRAIFSPDVDHQYVCAGSADGSVIIWNTLTARVEKVLKEHSSSVISLCWHPQGTHLISTDAKKKAVVWAAN